MIERATHLKHLDVACNETVACSMSTGLFFGVCACLETAPSSSVEILSNRCLDSQTPLMSLRWKKSTLHLHAITEILMLKIIRETISPKFYSMVGVENRNLNCKIVRRGGGLHCLEFLKSIFNAIASDCRSYSKKAQCVGPRMSNGIMRNHDVMRHSIRSLSLAHAKNESRYTSSKKPIEPIKSSGSLLFNKIRHSG